MDTLADLASMQSHQPARPHPHKNTSLESVKSVSSAAAIGLTQGSLTSNPRASFDINMVDMPMDTRRADFTKAALNEDDRQRLTELTGYLIENPSAYESHIAAITLLHRAFIDHVYPVSPSGQHLPKQDPASFELLEDLRKARNVMAKFFSVGETLWLDWLQDESMLATTTEQRIEVIETFRKAVDDEPASCKLWTAYGDWVLECYRWANAPSSAGTIDEDKLVGKEVFSWSMVMETWQDAINHTKHDLAMSHLVWNKFIELRLSEYKNGISKEQASQILSLFEQRLRTPHVDSDSTKQLLSNFMNAHFSQDQYFEIMADTGRIMKEALRLVEERFTFETRIEDAQAKEDKDSEYNTFVEYITWERGPAKRRKLDFDLTNSLYERLELRFPSDTALWEDHVAFAAENGRSGLDILSRATKHCPWSGSLWSQYLLASDRQGRSYEETESIKHKATSTGVIEAAGMQEALKVHAAWCSYLRRRACHPERDEDDADIAEVGIRTSMENMSNLGAKMGTGDVPDPTFRLQRIYIHFLSETGRWDNARREFDQAVRDYGKSWQFWMRFYHWEMLRWRNFEARSAKDEAMMSTSVPRLATAVLTSALDQDGLDYPEPILEALADHCEDYEDAEEMQSCLLKMRRYEKALAARRQVEAAQSASVAQALEAQKQKETEGQAETERPGLVKRKRDTDDSEATLHDNFKKSKTDEDAVATVEQTAAEDPKRDREHATILVENLPDHISEGKVRQFFSNCGIVKSLRMLDNGASALVEFEDDQAARYALSRDGQDFEDAILSVTLDTGSTVFLTNYSPTADEKEIRALLQPHGEIISTRFPSLQGNKKRRFCYVQFKLPAEAQSAVNELDGKDVNGYALTCKISNPAVKTARQETSVNDGRTVFVGRLNFKASEDEVKAAFSKYGEIQLIRMPLHETIKNRNKGIAFVTFTTGAEAQAALEMNGKKVKDREVRVEIATDQARSTRHESIPAHANGSHRDGSATIDGSEPRSERTIFVTNLSDTVNEARLRAVAGKHGEVVRCILKTNHQGALIEFATVAQAGEAALALEGYEISDGKAIRVVSEAEMKMYGPEKKSAEFSSRAKAFAAPASASGFVKRPSQPSGKTKKLGSMKPRIALKPGVEPMVAGETENGTSTESGGKKSNDDFRALMTGRGAARE